MPSQKRKEIGGDGDGEKIAYAPFGCLYLRIRN